MIKYLIAFLLFSSPAFAISELSTLVGNLGIGTTATAGYKLDVNGTVRMTGLTMTGNGIRVEQPSTASNGPNIVMGYSGNSVATQAYSSGISGGGISGGEQKINYSAKGGGHDQFQQIGCGYDNQMTSAWPSYICGAHNRINQAVGTSDTYFASSNLTGTISSSGVSVTGSTSPATAFTSLHVGQGIIANAQVRIIKTITDFNHLTVDTAFASNLSSETYASSNWSFPNIYHISYANTNHNSIPTGTYNQTTNAIYSLIGGGTQNLIGWDPYGLMPCQSDNAVINGGTNNSICGVPTVGTGTVTTSGLNVTGSNTGTPSTSTAFLTLFTSPGIGGNNMIKIGNEYRIVMTVADDYHLTINEALTSEATDSAYTASGLGTSSVVLGGENVHIRGKRSVGGGLDVTINGDNNVAIGQSITLGTTATNKTVRNTAVFGGVITMLEGANYCLFGGHGHTGGSAGSSTIGNYSGGVGDEGKNSAGYGWGTGRRWNIDMNGQVVQAYNHFATQGDAQGSTIVQHIQTTDATQTAMTNSGAAIGAIGGPQDLMFIRANQAVSFTIDILAKKTLTTDMARWQFQGMYYRDNSGNMGIVGGAVANTAPNSSNGTGSAWRVALDIDNASTSKALIIYVTGAAGETVGWVAYNKLVEALI